MKRENKSIMKTWGALLFYAVLSAAAVLSCSPLLEPPAATPAAAPAEDSGETGRVILSVSTDGEAPASARTILPTGTTTFSRYELVYSDSNGEHKPNTNGIDGEGITFELAAGTYTVTVAAYRRLTVTGGTEKEYLAAQGSKSITVKAGEVKKETITLEPVTNATARGVFTYKVTFPTDVTATLKLGNEAAVALASGTEVSVEKAPGYYNLLITATKGSLSASRSEKVHIYGGLESKAEPFTFTDADFVQYVYLQGRLNLTTGVVSDGKIEAYSDPEYKTLLEAADFPGGTNFWVIPIPIEEVPKTGPIYLKAEVSLGTNVYYTCTGNTGKTAPIEGIQDITLFSDTAPANVSDFVGKAGDRQVTLSWIDPPDADLNHIEISYGGQTLSVSKSNAPTRANSKTINGLTNGTPYAFTIRTEDNVGFESAESTAVILTPLAPTAGITVEFDGLPKDETKTLNVTQTQTISWSENTTLTVRVTNGNGDFSAYRWVLDGVAQTGAKVTENGRVLTLQAGDLSVRQHQLTVFVTKGGVEYAKRLIFTVAP
jgi:hypothetical protein